MAKEEKELREKTLFKLPQPTFDAPIRDFAVSMVEQRTMGSDGWVSQGQASNGTVGR